MTELTVIIVAAGEGTRMRSSRPKVLHEVGGLPIVGHVVKAARAAGATRIGVVTGPGHESVREAIRAIDADVAFFEQTERKGTAHAASMAAPLYESASGHVAIVYGDHPLLRGENFRLVTDRLEAGMDGAVLGFEPADPTGYGRLLIQGEHLLAIREHKDASAAEREIGLCNACILAFSAETFTSAIGRVGSDNAQGEYYLGDLVEIINGDGGRIGFGIAPEADVMGVNDRNQLARAEGLFQARKRVEAMGAGVTLIDPATVWFSHDTRIAQDVVVEPSVRFGPGVTIESGATILGFSHLEGCRVGAGATVGPFARLRPGADLAEKAKVGNFVEIKKARIGTGAKVSHLSYVGDATVGAEVNVGAGAIFVNYDGFDKHETHVGDGAFIGSNASLVAPLTIGAGALVASGSVITENVEVDALALGRARQVAKPGRGKAVFERAAAAKAARKG